MYSVGHPDEDVLEDYAMGKLPERELDLLEEHVLICEACQERVEATDTYVRSMRAALADSEPGQTERPWARWFQLPVYGWAAAGACAVLLLGLAVGNSRGVFPAGGLTGGNAPVAVVLSATRGEMASVPVAGSLDLALDARGLEPAAAYRLELVDAVGKPVWQQASAAMQDGLIHARVNKRLGPGQYFVRAFGTTGVPREYALQIHK